MSDPVNSFEQILNQYKGQVDKCLNDVLEEVANEALQTVSDEAKVQSRVVNSGRDWSDYIGQIGVTKQLDKFGTPKFTVHVNGTMHRLSHLLENGHATRSGGRTRAFPHFAKGQEWLDNNAEEYLRKKLEAIE